MTPEQIYEKAMKTLQERDRLKLVEMAKKRGIQKNKKYKLPRFNILYNSYYGICNIVQMCLNNLIRNIKSSKIISV